MKSTNKRWAAKAFAKAALLMLPILAAASNLSELQDSASNTVTRTFSDFTNQLSAESFGLIRLDHLERMLRAKESASVSQIDSKTGAQLSVQVAPSTQRAEVTYYLEGKAYQKLGVDYLTGVSLLTSAILKFKQPQSLRTENDSINKEEANDRRSMVGWQWRSDNFDCRVAMSNADVMGGDLIYQCVRNAGAAK